MKRLQVLVTNMVNAAFAESNLLAEVNQSREDTAEYEASLPGQS
jgi:hypothetical protein